MSDDSRRGGAWRILVGYHFRKAVREGIDHGCQSGEPIAAGSV